MSETVDIHDARILFSRLVARAEKGEVIIIARGGRPVARLVPLQPVATDRRSGRLKGKIRIRRNFDAPLPTGRFD